MTRVIFFFIFCLLRACSLEGGSAPVIDGLQVHTKSTTQHTVRQGDTLYSIAWRYNKDYRELARLNLITPPYHLNTGQAISLTTKRANKSFSKKVSSIGNHSTLSRSKHMKSANEGQKKVGKGPVKHWVWPAKGMIVKGFSLQSGGNKGIDIKGAPGRAVKASASGTVVYAGNGLPSYGNLLIIKHNSEYLSAYAYNRKLLVKEGDFVNAKQTIAEMGQSGRGAVQLHFEIRRAGKPVDPLRYLSKG